MKRSRPGDVYVLMLQVGESANSIAVCSSYERALEFAHRNFAAEFLLCAAGEYGGETMRIYEAIRDRLGSDDLFLQERNPFDEEESWIDAVTKDDTLLQPAMFTITKLTLDYDPDHDLGDLGSEPIIERGEGWLIP